MRGNLNLWKNKMTMIINNTKRFFPIKIRKNSYFLLLVLLFTACTAKSSFKIESFKTKTGWGYSIASNGKILIRQSIIPAINERKSFKTEKDALKTGHLVNEKLSKGLSPTITKNDLILLKIKL